MINFYNLIEEQESSYVSTIDIIVEESYAFKLDEMSIITESNDSGNVFKRLWNRFIQWIKNIWVKIKNFFKKLFGKNIDEVPITSEDIVNKRKSDIEKIIQKYISEKEFDDNSESISQYIDTIKYDVSTLKDIKLYKYDIRSFINRNGIKENDDDKKFLTIPKDIYEDAVYCATLSLISRVPYSRHTGLSDINIVTFDGEDLPDLENILMNKIVGLRIVDKVIILMNDIANAENIDDALSNENNALALKKIEYYLENKENSKGIVLSNYTKNMYFYDNMKSLPNAFTFPILNMGNCYVVKLNTLMYKYIYEYLYSKIKPIEKIKTMVKEPKLINDDKTRVVIKKLYDYFRLLVQGITNELNNIRNTVTLSYDIKVSNQFIEEIKYYIEEEKKYKIVHNDGTTYNENIQLVELISKKITNEIMKL